MLCRRLVLALFLLASCVAATSCTDSTVATFQGNGDADQELEPADGSADGDLDAADNAGEGDALADGDGWEEELEADALDAPDGDGADPDLEPDATEPGEEEADAPPVCAADDACAGVQGKPYCVGGECVECRENAQCPQGWCNSNPANHCEPWTCEPGAAWCDNTTAHLCNSIGNGEQPVTECGPVGCAAGVCNLEKALDFDGASGAVDLGNAYLVKNLPAATVEAWVYLDPNTSGVRRWEVFYTEGKGDATWGALQFGVSLDTNNEGHVTFGERQNDGTWIFGQSLPDGTIKAGVWFHLAGTKSDNSFAVFINGKKFNHIVTAEATAAPAAPGAMIGRAAHSDSFFPGVVDEVRLSSVARYTEDFIPAPRFEADADTIGLWHFNEGQGSAVTDAGPNAHDGQIQGGAAWTDQAVWRVWECAPQWKTCDAGQNAVNQCNDYGQWTTFQSCQPPDLCTVAGAWDAACQ